LCLFGYNMFAISASLFVMRCEPVRNPVADQYAPEASEKL
jgi:hypothetical protein